ncbi:MAG: SH3 domain-containing protein [Bacteroidetes bacterium]|nr:MAG: SH3 domain-containing protein [Bacteroidota bacterium]
MKSFIIFPLLPILGWVFLASCSGDSRPARSPFEGEWIGIERDVTVLRQDSVFWVTWYEKSGEVQDVYQAKENGSLLSYSDEDGHLQIFKLFLPGGWDGFAENGYQYSGEDSIKTRLIFGQEELYLSFRRLNKKPGMRGYQGFWVSESPSRWGMLETIELDSTEHGLSVKMDYGVPQGNTSVARGFEGKTHFQGDLIYLATVSTDEFLYGAYDRACDCITAGKQRYHRANKSSGRFVGDWKSRNGIVRVVENGPYFVVHYGYYRDYFFSGLYEAKGGKLLGLGAEGGGSILALTGPNRAYCSHLEEDVVRRSGFSNLSPWYFEAFAPEAPPVVGKQGVINDPDGYTNMRIGPGSRHAVVQKVLEGETFEILDQSSDWWKIRVKSGKMGFMHKSRIRQIH